MSTGTLRRHRPSHLASIARVAVLPSVSADDALEAEIAQVASAVDKPAPDWAVVAAPSVRADLGLSPITRDKSKPTTKPSNKE